LIAFLRDYTSGVDVRTVHRVLGRDASQAYRVLTREHADEPEPAGRLGKLWHRTRIIFLGLSYKLSPPRRVLFLASLVLAAAGLYLFAIDETIQLIGFVNPYSLLVVAVVGLVFVLALELADRVVVRDELEIARQLQRDLLPALPPPVEGYTFRFSYRTANTIGGDFYDFLPLADGRLVLVVGDASGHGIAAGLLMAIASAALNLAIDLDPNPAAVVDLMNRALYRTGGSRAFMTMFYGVLDPADGGLEFVSVGHPFPILRRADGEIHELGTGSLPLGVRQEIAPRPGVTRIQPGDLLVLYTDGIPETIDESGGSFGFDRIRRQILIGGTPEEVHDRLLAELESFAGRVPMHDDRSLVVVGRVKTSGGAGGSSGSGRP
jgi:hypothetical protein